MAPLLLRQPLRFTEEAARSANEVWGCNCGPAATAAMLGLTLAEVRPHLGDFESKRYTNPTLMAEILRNLKAPVIEFGKLNAKLEMTRTGRKPWPRHGLARVQWEGPWTNPGGVPLKARYRHTHWVGTCCDDAYNMGIWDVNCLNNGTGWVGLDGWTNVLVPWLLEACHPRANGKWHLTHIVEIERARI